MSEQVDPGQIEEKEAPASGLLLSVTPLQGNEQYSAKQRGNDNTDLTDTLSDAGTDADGTDESDRDIIDGSDADGTDAEGTDTDGTDILGDSDNTDRSGDTDSTDAR